MALGDSGDDLVAPKAFVSSDKLHQALWHLAPLRLRALQSLAENSHL